jgi:uroporphyrinogen-III decarboxylase
MSSLVESGLDCLNPVQCNAHDMDPLRLKQAYGGRITFWGGGVDTQRTLPFGTPEEVYNEVRERIRIFGPGGGFVFNPVHNVQAGTPPENLEAMFQALKDHGRYSE